MGTSSRISSYTMKTVLISVAEINATLTGVELVARKLQELSESRNFQKGNLAAERALRKYWSRRAKKLSVIKNFTFWLYQQNKLSWLS